jgi:hypothetical protein
LTFDLFSSRKEQQLWSGSQHSHSPLRHWLCPT